MTSHSPHHALILRIPSMETPFNPQPIFRFKDPEDEISAHRELWLKLQRFDTLYPWPKKAAVKLRLPTKEGTCA